MLGAISSIERGTMAADGEEIMDDPRADLRDDGRDAYSLDISLRAALRDAVAAQDVASIDALMDPLHPADIADLLEQIKPVEREGWLSLWSKGIDGEVLSELEEGLREDVLELLPDQVIAEAVRELDSDDVVDLIEDLEEEQQEQILDALEPCLLYTSPSPRD